VQAGLNSGNFDKKINNFTPIADDLLTLASF